MNPDLLQAYDEYCVDCYAEGVAPQAFLGLARGGR